MLFYLIVLPNLFANQKLIMKYKTLLNNLMNISISNNQMILFCQNKNVYSQKLMELRGIEPRASPMRRERDTTTPQPRSNSYP